jgi:hypothetical protein
MLHVAAAMLQAATTDVTEELQTLPKWEFATTSVSGETIGGRSADAARSDKRAIGCHDH